jgi:hypothetical protein
MAEGSWPAMEKSELQENLEKWLRTQGYPLEMRTAQRLHQRGWTFHHSRHYKDPMSGKEREIDLLAFYDDPARSSRIHGHFVIECKWTPKKPWVLFTSALPSLTPLGHFRATPMTQTAVNAVDRVSSQGVEKFSLYFGFEEGYGIVQAFTKDAAVDAAFSAVHAVVSAADYFAQSMSEKTKHSIIYVPTVIIDGSLFSCCLNGDGEVSIRELDIGFMIYKSATTSLSRCIYIVRDSALTKFIDRAEATFKSLRKTLSSAK